MSIAIRIVLGSFYDESKDELPNHYTVAAAILRARLTYSRELLSFIIFAARNTLKLSCLAVNLGIYCSEAKCYLPVTFQKSDEIRYF